MIEFIADDQDKPFFVTPEESQLTGLVTNCL